ncbi:MAG: glutamate synthase-related protein, partial [Bryocella sp.]
SLDTPFLSLGQVAALRAGKYPHVNELTLEELPCLYTADKSLEQAIEELGALAVDKVRNGAKLLLLSDRGASSTAIPIPMAMATGVVHQRLVDAGLRTLCGMLVEAGDCRDIHHAAILISYGAGAVCPWMALETAISFDGSRGFPEDVDAEKLMLKSLNLGMAKVMSKMGISVVDSYRGAHLFDILGLHSSVVDKCFPNTPAPLSGIGFAELDRRLRLSWQAEAPVADLPDFGWIRFRKADAAEPHRWQPTNVKMLQTVVGSVRGGAPVGDVTGAFNIFSNSIDTGESATVRGLLEIHAAGPELTLDEVEDPKSLCHHFVSSAMSLGSLSPEAHQTITAGMNMFGERSNTGEGGEDSVVYRPRGAAKKPRPDGGAHAEVGGSGGAAVAELILAPALLEPGIDLNNKIKQIASGRFGVTAEYLAHAVEIEIKVAQGAKPGEGGQLPAHKVSGLIARLRHAQPGVALISPPPHHDIYSIEDLAQLIYDLKRVNPRAAVGVKLVSSCGVGTIAAGVAKAYADYIVIAGNTGGTGAAAISSIKYAGNPWELGLSEAQQSLRATGMRERVRLRTDGGIATAHDVLIAALLGADEFAFGTAVMVSIGCDMARQCHLNTCPTGIATQRPELRAKFRGKPEHVMQYFQQLGKDLQKLLAKFGLPTLASAIGRVDLLEQVRFDGNLDLTPILSKEGNGPTHWMGMRNDRPGVDDCLDDDWTAPAIAAAKKHIPFVARAKITNAHRSVGARLGGELGVLRAKGEVEEADVTFELDGTAGQSFGAFAAEGQTL